MTSRCRTPAATAERGSGRHISKRAFWPTSCWDCHQQNRRAGSARTPGVSRLRSRFVSRTAATPPVVPVPLDVQFAGAVWSVHDRAFGACRCDDEFVDPVEAPAGAGLALTRSLVHAWTLPVLLAVSASAPTLVSSVSKRAVALSCPCFKAAMRVGAARVGGRPETSLQRRQADAGGYGRPETYLQEAAPGEPARTVHGHKFRCRALRDRNARQPVWQSARASTLVLRAVDLRTRRRPGQEAPDDAHASRRGRADPRFPADGRRRCRGVVESAARATWESRSENFSDTVPHRGAFSRMVVYPQCNRIVPANSWAHGAGRVYCGRCTVQNPGPRKVRSSRRSGRWNGVSPTLCVSRGSPPTGFLRRCAMPVR